MAKIWQKMKNPRSFSKTWNPSYSNPSLSAVNSYSLLDNVPKGALSKKEWHDMTTFISQQTLDNCIFWPELTHCDVCYTHTHMERPSANNVARETQQITLCPRKYISKHCYLYPRETGKGSVGEADTAFHCRLLAPTQMSAGI